MSRAHHFDFYLYQAIDGGHALLLSHQGYGRRTLTRLAAHAARYTVCRLFCFVSFLLLLFRFVLFCNYSVSSRTVNRGAEHSIPRSR